MSNDNFNKRNDAGEKLVERSIRLDMQDLRTVALLAVLLYCACWKILETALPRRGSLPLRLMNKSC